jgi:DNA-binding transcriptional ArsR family regulator/SAM-dependent methyltransferase
VAERELQDRCELYRVLAEPVRLRLLAAAAEEELSIGELTELLGESQPNVSRHLAQLRKLGLLLERRQGTRVFVRLTDAAQADPVVADAVGAARALFAREGTLERIGQLIRQRDAVGREFFARGVAHNAADVSMVPDELAAYLMAIAPLLPRRQLAVDVGTGEGRLLDVLAPLFDHVIAVDREPAQLERAALRSKLRGYENVTLLQGDLHSSAVHEAVSRRGLGDVVFASRILHHAPRPAEAIAELATLTKPDGTLIVLDYAAHDDETMREQQADLWLGFAPEELARFATHAGFSAARSSSIPELFRGAGPDRHLPWQVFSARRTGAHGMNPSTDGERYG